jgi:hypothetical protein
MTEEEEFFAWLDGELSGAEAAEMEARVAADPKLSELAAQHRAMQARLNRRFDSLLGAPVPEGLVAAARKPEAEIVDFWAAKQARERRLWPSMPQWAAVAATLAIGIFVGTQVPERSAAPVEVQGGKIYAVAGLDQALDAQLASVPSNGAVRIGLTFRDQGGSICRSFTQRQASGLACRDGDRWAVRGLFAAPEGQAGDYRMAAGMDPNLAVLVDSTIAGEPFDATAEKAARQQGWR